MLLRCDCIDRGRDCIETGRTCETFSTDSRECIVVGDSEFPLLRRRSAEAAGLGGPSAQGAKGAGRGASNWVDLTL
jgi:hypothetical protein